MKYPITRFKNLSLALKELEQYVRNGEHLQTGKPFEQFGGLRSREMWGNWLICALLCAAYTDQNRFIFTTDPDNGDGTILDNTTGTTYLTEHVLVPSIRGTKKRILMHLFWMP